MIKINEKVIVCGLVKDCGRTLEYNISLALNALDLFENGKLIIYENNSKDNTKTILNRYKEHENVLIISEDLDSETIKKNSRIWAYTEITGSDHPCRIEMICNARNKVLAEINKMEYDDFTYVIWIDMDSNGYNLKGIENSFLSKKDWDVVYANGIEHGSYYDLYALRTDDKPYGPEIIGEHFWKNMGKITMTYKGGLIPVYSAFGGIGIYKKEIFQKYTYDCIVNEQVELFYNNYIRENPLTIDMKKIIENADKKFPNGYKSKNSSIFWKANSGYNKPVVCEHVCLNLALINAGYRIFINPLMIYKR
jgi:hypothetical protein